MIYILVYLPADKTQFEDIYALACFGSVDKYDDLIIKVTSFQSEVTAGNVRSLVNRLSRDMSNRNPFSVHQSVEKRGLLKICLLLK